MEIEKSILASAKADFQQARQQAALQEVLGRLTGQDTALLSFDEAYKKLKATGIAERGLQDIPIEAIVGSVNRYTDFTRSFLPRLDSDAERWATVKAIATDPTSRGLEPIQVYKIGEAYFVSDGNHRVSVARQLNAPSIEGYVTEVQTRVPLSAAASPEELILKSEYAEFLEETHLDRLRPGIDLLVTVPGQYDFLRAEIDAHCRWLAATQPELLTQFNDLQAAIAHWYDTVYMPVVLSIRERGLLRDFPERTETDLYIWIAEHRSELESELGWQVKPQAAAESLVAESAAGAGGGLLGVLVDGPAAGEWRKDKIEDRYTDRLFRDILVPITGDEIGWHALSQAIGVAQREGARLNGLHVVATDSEKESDNIHIIREIFDRQCAEAGVAGTLAVEVGEVSTSICKRALLSDLVIVNLAHPPSAQRLARLGSGFRTLIRRCARPVLAVPGTSTPLTNILLAYDGSPKAKEALFVATYFAEQWRSALTVLTVTESEATEAAIEHARQYLQMHELNATFLEREKMPVSEAVLGLANEIQADLIVMGGYSKSPVVEIVVGSAVDHVLRESNIPMLICR
jgi:nucleotide-binding universal stress UspA family protein